MTAQAVFKNEPGGLYKSLYTAEANFAEKAHDIVAVLLERSRLFHRYRRRRPKALVEQTRNGREERRNKAGLISGTTSPTKRFNGASSPRKLC